MRFVLVDEQGQRQIVSDFLFPIMGGWLSMSPGSIGEIPLNPPLRKGEEVGRRDLLRSYWVVYMLFSRMGGFSSPSMLLDDMALIIVRLLYG